MVAAHQISSYPLSFLRSPLQWVQEPVKKMKQGSLDDVKCWSPTGDCDTAGVLIRGGGKHSHFESSNYLKRLTLKNKELRFGQSCTRPPSCNLVFILASVHSNLWFDNTSQRFLGRSPPGTLLWSQQPEFLKLQAFKLYWFWLLMTTFLIHPHDLALHSAFQYHSFIKFPSSVLSGMTPVV